MKFLTRRKKKEKTDEDATPTIYQPPNIGPSANAETPPNLPQQLTHEHLQSQQQQQQPSQPSPTVISDPIHSSYRHSLSLYASTISPALSNEDGFGGGGTLRSRSTKAGGKKHRTLIPVFVPNTPSSSVSGGYYGVEMDRYSISFDETGGRDDHNVGGNEEHWAPIPEEVRSPSCLSEDDNNHEVEDHEEGQEQVIGQSSSEAHSETRSTTSSSLGIRTEGPPTRQPTPESSASNHINFQSSTLNNYIQPNNSQPSTSPTSTQSGDKINTQPTPESIDYEIRISTKDLKPNTLPTLQPDAIYEEHYGDAYVDQLIKYLYPSGYQSMRPRSGPWKLSIFICILFLWLSVFIVGHCYDRGQEYNYYFGHADDAYLQEVDDDTLVMETRWCGSKLIYFMWFVCVSITMLAMSYCSIIGYIKLRDTVVANGRSQPPGMMSNTGGRSDCYANVGNATYGDGKESSTGSSVTTGYSSYQDGVMRRYPAIYQSDGTPQFWGGHIYKPTQAAVSMTNR